MRWVPLVVLVAAVAVWWPAGRVGAHTLPVAVAAAKAYREALLIAGELRSERPRISVRSSVRRSRHMVDNRVRYRFIDAGLVCYQWIRVRFVLEGSQRLRVSFPGEPRCTHS